jgi:hypothetical protein
VKGTIKKATALRKIWRLVNEAFEDTQGLDLYSTDESDVYREKMESIMQVILQYRGLAALPRRDIIAKRFFWGYSVAAIRESTGAPSALIESILRWYLQPENAKALQEARGR